MFRINEQFFIFLLIQTFFLRTRILWDKLIKIKSFYLLYSIVLLSRQSAGVAVDRWAPQLANITEHIIQVEVSQCKTALSVTVTNDKGHQQQVTDTV